MSHWHSFLLLRFVPASWPPLHHWGGFYSGIRTTSVLWQRQPWELLRCLRLRFTRFRFSFPLWLRWESSVHSTAVFYVTANKNYELSVGTFWQTNGAVLDGSLFDVSSVNGCNHICHAGYAVVFPLHRNLGNFWIIICFVGSFPLDDFVDAFYPLWNAGGYKRFCACFQSDGRIGRIVCTVDFAGQ